MADEPKDAEVAPGAPAAKAPAKPAAPAAKAAAPAAPDMKPAAPAGPTDPPPPAGATVPSFISALQAGANVGDWTAIVSASRLLEVARYLRDTPEFAFDFCSDVTASDWPTRPQRFDVIYCLYSTRFRSRLRLKLRAAGSESAAIAREFDLSGVEDGSHV